MERRVTQRATAQTQDHPDIDSIHNGNGHPSQTQGAAAHDPILQRLAERANLLKSLYHVEAALAALGEGPHQAEVVDPLLDAMRALHGAVEANTAQGLFP